MVSVGDIFEIELKDTYKSYGQYVYKDKKQGPLIQIFDLIIKDGINDVYDLQHVKYLFPPVITGLYAAIKLGLWRTIGKIPVVNFIYPLFVTSFYDEKSGEAYRWFLWDGEKYLDVGKRLPNKYKKLEYLIVWSPYDVITRIETGEYPYPYGDLIRKNKFIPQKTLD